MTLQLVRAAGVATAAVCALGVATFLATGRQVRVGQIQLGSSPSEVQSLLATQGRRRSVGRALTWDYFFIAAYLIAFWLLAALLSRRGDLWVVPAAAAALSAPLTATLDVRENALTARLLRTASRREISSEQLTQLRRASLEKWFATALTVALLAMLFLQAGWIVTLAIALLGVAAIGVAGMRWHALIFPFFISVFVGTLVIAVLCLGWPKNVVAGF